jgi:hypothetical protein
MRERMTRPQIVNDTLPVNKLLQGRLGLKDKALLDKEYYGTVTIKFEKGMAVHYEKKESYKIG